MAENYDAESNGGACLPSLRVGRIYRRKHTLRAIFRCSSLVLLLTGYALYHHFGGSSRGFMTPSRRLKSTAGVSTSVSQNLRKSQAGRRVEESNEYSRLLQDGDQAEAQAENCPVLEVANPKWFAALYAVGTLYMFLALAIVCDEFFVPALEEMSSERHLNLSMDVAGATLMAAGGSAPELFTSFVGTFKQSDIGIGTIVGSAVFNVLFVIGMCSLLSKEVLTLTWWPLFRDSSYYAAGLGVLSLLAGVLSKGEIHWWEALILLGMYLGYVLLMYFNRKLYTKLTGKVLRLPGECDDKAPSEEGGDGDAPKTAANTNGAAATGVGQGGAPTPTPLLSDDRLESFTDHNASALSQCASPSDRTTAADFRWPGTFRAGVLELLLHPESWKEKGGIGIVAKIQGDVNHVFEQVDTNGDGGISKEELGQLFKKLGHDICEEELWDVFRSVDLDGDGTIHKEEFSAWYISSEERIRSKVKPIFDKFDTDKSGTIDRGEVCELLKTLEPQVTNSDVDDAINAMWQSGCKDQITYEEFADWYVHSIIYSRHHTDNGEEEAQGVCEALSPPRGEGVCSWLKYLIVLPLVAVMTFTIPDVRRRGWENWCYVSFLLSIVWIGLFSFFMVDWVEILGNTIGIPSVVMGYTVLAAGTSVPDLFSSVIVARMGEGDMAVSSSIGSNIFDILVGLPLPWLVFTLWPSTPDVVIIQAKGIWQSIFILMGMLVAIIAIVHCQGWKMTKTLGGLMFLLYFLFLVQAILTEYVQNTCFG